MLNAAGTPLRAHHSKWGTSDSLKNLNTRIQTFSDWPVRFIKAEDLARAGFYYMKTRDYVECIFCRGIICDWQVGDKPMVVHKDHFGWCRFVKGLPTGNVEEPGPGDEAVNVHRGPDLPHLPRVN